MRLKFLSLLVLPLVALASPVRDDLAGKAIAATDNAEPLPYDAEVEYLGCTGTQYINTGFTLFGAESFWWDVAASISDSSASGQRMFSSEGSSPKYYDCLYNASQRKLLVRPWASIYIEPDTVIRTAYDGEGLYFFIDGELVSEIHGQDCQYTAVTNRQSVYLMTRANIHWKDEYKLIGNFYYAKFWLDGELVRDMYPVRFTNAYGDAEGAMYDKVSGELFRNQGTGYFVIGPDKE